MAGPCPNGRSTMKAHKEAKCREREKCQGPGCRLYREARQAPETESE